jgi:hypothetical protein
MNTSEQRRFPRLRIRRTLAHLVSDLNAQAVWPNHEISDLADLSYKGMAVQIPGVFSLGIHDWVTFTLELGKNVPFTLMARVVWRSQDLAGLEMLDVPPEGHNILGRFLNDQLMGAALKPVQVNLVNKGESFAKWYQGPGLNVFIWQAADGTVEKVQVEFVDEMVELNSTKVIDRDLERRAILVLAHLSSDVLPMENFVRQVTGAKEGMHV